MNLREAFYHETTSLYGFYLFLKTIFSYGANQGTIFSYGARIQGFVHAKASSALMDQ